LVSLINASVENFSRACAARTSTTGIGKVNTLLFRCVKDVLIIGTAKAGSTLDADRERSHVSITDQLLINEVYGRGLGSSEIPNPAPRASTWNISLE
jgi:hypothetical protein